MVPYEDNIHTIRTIHVQNVIQQEIAYTVSYLVGCMLLMCYLTLLEPRSRFGDKLPRIRLLCPQNGTAVLKGLILSCFGALLKSGLF